MQIRVNHADKCLLVRLSGPCRCVGDCGRTLQPATLAWSYLPDPKDGNYVECGPCRYGCEPVE